MILKFIIIVAALFSATVPASPAVHADIYKNIIEAPGARIVNGENANRHQFPYQCSLEWSPSGSSFSHICGCILASPTRALTAGHCKAYTYGIYRVRCGLLLRNENHADIQVFTVKDFVVHPGYPGGVAANDIAMLKFEEPATLTDAVKPVDLANEEDCNAIEDTILSGWGRTSSSSALPNQLQWAKLPRITNEQCAEDLEALLGSSYPLDSTMICITSNPGKGQSACNGDSGGPLVLFVNGKCIGIVSWGISPCGYPRAPSVFTRVCSHFDFIKQHLNE